MITPILERLILQGKARFKNWSYGVGQLGCIPVTTGETAIIVDFTVEPFLMWQTEKLRAAQENMPLIRIQSGKTVNDYVLKWGHSSSPDGVYEAGYMAKRYDCFIVANDPIRIHIAMFPPDSTWALVLNAPMNDAAEPQAPLGYNGSNVLSSINFNGQAQYKPMTETLNKLNAGSGSRDELNINFDPFSNPAIDTKQPMCPQIPIINFSVIYINENLNSILLSSK